jgi:hypothetical protein
MLRCAQHDRFSFFHTFLRRGLEDFAAKRLGKKEFEPPPGHIGEK